MLALNPVARGPSPRELKAAWQKRLKRARSLYAEKVAIRKEMLAEHRDRVWPSNLEPDPDGRFALHQALQEESAARTEYMRILRIFNELNREGTPPEEEPGLFLVGRETGTNLHRLSAMNDEEDQETPFQEMDGDQLDEKTAWVRLFLREASKLGYTIEDVVGDEEDGDQLDEKTAWARLFLREASKLGFTIQDIVALLDEPGMTAKEAVERILSARKLK